MRKDCVLFCSGAQLIKPTLAFFVFNNIANGEEDKIKNEGDEGDYRVGQKLKSAKGGMNDKHRIDVVCPLRRDQDTKNEITIKTYRIHTDDGE